MKIWWKKHPNVVEVSAKEKVVLTCLEIIRMVSLSKLNSELIGQHIPTKVIILSLKRNHNHFSRNATSRWSTILKPQTPGRVIYLESHRFLDFADFDGGGDVTANRWDPEMRVECLLFSKNNDVKLGGGFKYVLFSPQSLGKWSNLTYIFQMGWNHQLEKLDWSRIFTSDQSGS